jgi:hypothetical protein
LEAVFFWILVLGAIFSIFGSDPSQAQDSGSETAQEYITLQDLENFMRANFGVRVAEPFLTPTQRKDLVENCRCGEEAQKNIRLLNGYRQGIESLLDESKKVAQPIMDLYQEFGRYVISFTTHSRFGTKTEVDADVEKIIKIYNTANKMLPSLRYNLHPHWVESYSLQITLIERAMARQANGSLEVLPGYKLQNRIFGFPKDGKIDQCVVPIEVSEN